MGKEQEEQLLEEEAEKLTEIEIAELANKEMRKKDAEIAKLTKELAKAKLLSVAEEEETSQVTREECLKVLGDSNTSNYDYAQAVVDLVDIEIAEGRPNPLGRDGEKVQEFFKDVLKECGDDKSRFPAVYQSKIGADDKLIAAAYNKNKR